METAHINAGLRLFAAAERFGISPAELTRTMRPSSARLLHSVGRGLVPPEQRAESRLPMEDVVRLWDELVERVPAADILNAVSTSLPLDSWGALGFAAMTAPNVLLGLSTAAEGFAFWSTSGKWTTQATGDRVTLTLNRTARSKGYEAANEAVLLGVSQLAAALCGHEITPFEVTTSHRKPAVGRLDTALGVKVRYGAGRDSVVLQRQALEVAPRLDVPLLHRHFRRQLGLDRRPEEFLPHTQAVRREVFEHLDRRELSFDAIAKALGASRRTLGRRLEQEGTSYQAEVDYVRRERAVKLLRYTNEPISNIAEALGFATDSAFIKAFKQWCGVSPGAYRQQFVPSK